MGKENGELERPRRFGLLPQWEPDPTGNTDDLVMSADEWAKHYEALIELDHQLKNPNKPLSQEVVDELGDENTILDLIRNNPY